MGNTPRKVKFATIFNILKRNPIPATLGFGFTIISLPFLILLLTIEDDVPKIDYELINQNGIETVAQITDIETEYNTKINGVHPTVISYKYLENETQKNSKFRTLSERKVARLEIGNEIDIKYLDNKSIIKDFKHFNSDFLKFIPLIFLVFGLPMFLYSVYQIRKEINLYKYGKLAKGKILSMITKSGLPVSKMGQGIIVHYQYQKSNGQKNVGESFTTDFSILGDKKKDDLLPIFISNESEDKSCIVPKLESLRNNWNIEFE